MSNRTQYAIVRGSSTTDFGTNVKIGASSDGTSRFFEGSIDSVRVYERALSGTEISDMSRGVLMDANDSGS